MLEEYVYHGAKRLRCGYTTGSCAAAAAKAAAMLLLGGVAPDSVELMTPKGVLLDLKVLEPILDECGASCAVRKDGGDDPDVTDGILVYARVEKNDGGISIEGGEGVGVVTKPGLDQPVGAAAINSVPQKMIKEAVAKAAEEKGYLGGLKITVYVPGGAEIAKKTYNPRMGIEGGISIIGTTGIVEPMSSAALIDTIRTEMKMRRAEGREYLLLTPGNYGETFIDEKMPFSVESAVKCSNYIGDSLDAAMEFGFRGALIVGHIGKLVKLGAGIMNTHSAVADGRMETLVTCAVLAGADMETLKKIPACVTADAALELLSIAGKMDAAMEILMNRAGSYLSSRVKGGIKAAAVMFSDKFGLLGGTDGADELISLISEEENG